MSYVSKCLKRLLNYFVFKVIATELDEPFAITVDPISGLMFWSDNGLYTKIERSSLDGSNRTGLLFSEIIKSVTGLAADPMTRTLYW
jgi:low density lipoprotein receptor-related protein 5/6